MAESASEKIRLCLAVAVGAGIGSVLRFQTAFVIMKNSQTGDFLATAVVNVVGSFVITLFAGLAGPNGRLNVGKTTQQFVMGGLCGGYTTRSLMSLNTFILIFQKHWIFGAAYVIVVVALSLAAAWLGHVLALVLNRHPIWIPHKVRVD